jgi:hypothetical protein
MRCIIVLSVVAMSCKGSAGSANDLTYFDANIPSKFSNCGKPPCKMQVGRGIWSLARFVLDGDVSYVVPALRTTNGQAKASPTIWIAGKNAKVHPSKVRDVSVIAAGATVDEYSSTDVPCVSHATCRTSAIMVDGKLVASVYSICYEVSVHDVGGVTNTQSINPEVIGKARAVQDDRLPRLATERTLADEDHGMGWDFVTHTHVRYDDKMVVGVNGNVTDAHPQFDPASTTGCVNTFAVLRSPVTELLVKKYDEAGAAEAEWKNSTVPH